MCIGRAIDENVKTSKVTKTSQTPKSGTKTSQIPSNKYQNVLHSDLSLSSARTKTSQIPISKVRKRPRFRSARYENVPDSDQLGRSKRPRFQSARTKTSHIPISKDENVPDSDRICLVLMRSSAIFRKICEKVRLGQKYAELCGEWRIMRHCAENRKLCDIALTALKCCL